jgi:20S proteasome alpha/beta subunit
VVLASDSQATYLTGGLQVKGDIKKLVPQWRNVVWGASGNVGVAQHVRQLLANSTIGSEAYFENRAAETVAKEICDVIRPGLRAYYSELLNYPSSSPWTSFLFCGWVRDGPLLFELGADLIVSDHRHAGYAAIGSGEVFPYFALASLAHHGVRERSLGMATLIAHRVVNDAISVAAYGLGPPVQMITIPAGGQAQVREDIQAIEDGVRQWQEIERDALQKYLERPASQSADDS